MAQVSLSTRISYETDKLLEKYVAKSGQSKASIVEKALLEFLMKVVK